MAVTAPFQFARIPRAVWFPEWGHLVSHDVPFADGYSGTIDIEIEAMTPLLIGGERRAGKKPLDRNQNPRTEEERNGKEGEVWPVQLPDGTYAIPGSSLQGMIRNILEIACFGKLGPWVDQRRFGIRDVSGSATGTAAYASRMNHRDDSGTIVPDAKAGWLRRDGDKFFLMRCEMARIDYTILQPLSSASLTPPPPRQPKRDYAAAPTWKKKSDVAERYDWLNFADVHFTLSSVKTHDHRQGALNIKYDLANRVEQAAFAVSFAGKLVLTGNASDPPARAGDPHKHMEFIFYGEGDEEELGEDFDARFEEFVAIHEPDDGRPKNPNWAFYKNHGHPGSNGWMPIFYLADADEPKRIESFGLAFMFKLAHKNDTHDMLKNSSADHVDEYEADNSDSGRFDLASLIFGAVQKQGEKQWFEHSLKRRASFDWAPATLPPNKDIEIGKANGQPRNAILLGPKPSYYPIYVRQPAPLNSLYATHTPAKRRREADNHSHTDTDDEAVTRFWPELSGAKIWPNAGKSRFTDMPDLPPKTGNSVQNKLNALPIGTKFRTKLHVHNLSKVELSALLWALTFGDQDAISADDDRFGKCHQRIGMGKPFGLGEMKMAVRKVDLTCNSDPGRRVEIEEVKQLVGDDKFAEMMDNVCDKLATDGEPDRTWQWLGNGDQPPKVTWLETSQVKALRAAALANRNQSLGYMELGKANRNENTGYVGERVLEKSLEPFCDGWELSGTHDPAEIEFAPQLPTAVKGGQASQSGQRNQIGQNRSADGNQDRQRQADARPSFCAEVGCPVQNIDGRIGEISKIEFGLCHIRLQSGEVVNWPTNTFTVIGPPED